VESFPDLPHLERVIGFLPDTILMEIRGLLVPLDQSHLALLVDRLQAAKIPIPGRLIADVLEALGRDRPQSLPDDAIEVPMPDGVRSVFVQRDSLVMLANEREGSQ
jgi:hypothetical protein